MLLDLKNREESKENEYQEDPKEINRSKSSFEQEFPSDDQTENSLANDHSYARSPDLIQVEDDSGSHIKINENHDPVESINEVSAKTIEEQTVFKTKSIETFFNKRKSKNCDENQKLTELSTEVTVEQEPLVSYEPAEVKNNKTQRKSSRKCANPISKKRSLSTDRSQASVESNETSEKKLARISTPPSHLTFSRKFVNSDDEEDFKGWESQLKKITLPAPELKLWIYQNVCDLSFAKTPRGFVYKCLSQGCRFQTLISERMKSHLESNHAMQQWNGFCNICGDNTVGGRGNVVLEEFEHMIKIHIQQEDSESILKLLESPPQKISSEVSKETSSTSVENNAEMCLFATSTSLSESVEKPIPEKPATPKNSTAPLKKVSVEPKEFPDTFEACDKKKPQEPTMKWLRNNQGNSKPEDLLELMLSRESLTCRFKCMSSTCSFFTSDMNIFMKHLKLHELFTASDKEAFLSCSYCAFSTSTPANLVSHIDQKHVYDRFQCNYCFYRSCSDFNVIFHQIESHQDSKNVILECPEIKERDRRAELEIVKTKRIENVPPIICVFCRAIFYVKSAFLLHISQHSKKLKALCITCGEKTTIKTVEQHLEKCLGIGLYQCVFCSTGTNTFEDLQNHIAISHPSELPVFCERVEHRNPDGSLKNVSSN